jgi:heterodisulfide reductase subunit B
MPELESCKFSARIKEISSNDPDMEFPQAIASAVFVRVEYFSSNCNHSLFEHIYMFDANNLFSNEALLSKINDKLTTLTTYEMGGVNVIAIGTEYAQNNLSAIVQKVVIENGVVKTTVEIKKIDTQEVITIAEVNVSVLPTSDSEYSIEIMNIEILNLLKRTEMTINIDTSCVGQEINLID